jgi:kynurenine formamidase
MLIDVSQTIKPGAVYRLGTPPVEIVAHRFFHESEGEYESTMISLTAHTGTHLDLVTKGKHLDPQRMIGSGKLINVAQMAGQEVRLKDIGDKVRLESGDFVFFRTDWSRFLGTQKYHDHPQLSPEVIQWLISTQINVVGIDAPGVGRGRSHGEYDRLLIENDIFVIENLTNLSAIPKREFKAYCFPLKIENIDAIPARVLVEIEETG